MGMRRLMKNQKEKKMDELDLSGVDALRWPEVRRRVDVVRDFLKIAAPTEADQAASAGRLGLSVNQFMALVRAWRQHRSAAMIAGSGAHRGAARSPSRLSVQKEAREASWQVIDEIGADGSFAHIHREVQTRCANQKLSPPSRSTLWNMVMSRRKGRRGADGGIVVGTCRVRLPMEHDGAITLPPLTIAVRLGDGGIVAVALSVQDWSEFLSAAALRGSPIRVDEELLRSPTRPSEGIIPVGGTVARSSLSRALGRGIDSVQLIYQPSRAVPAERLLKTKDDRPLSTRDMREVVVRAVARHNAARGAALATWVDSVSASPAS
jgi:hypothetical protein